MYLIFAVMLWHLGASYMVASRGGAVVGWPAQAAASKVWPCRSGIYEVMYEARLLSLSLSCLALPAIEGVSRAWSIVRSL